MAHFPKPAEGSWTEHYPELGTGPVDYEDSISPEFYELERKAVFAKTWLNVGRVEQIPRTGRYFTKELQCAGTSVVIVRDRDGGVRGFHNICRHRGNKLVWNDFPNEETSGTCRQFTCKYHGWRYDLDGSLTFVQQESEFFDLDKADFGLVPVQTEVWEGFIFVNLDPDNTTSVREYLGGFGAGIEGYPFGEMTQVYKYRATVGSNWKLFIDAFAEFYHAPVLHAKQATDEESLKLQGFGFEGLAYGIDGPHGMVSSWGGMSPPKDLMMVKPIERVLRSGLFGPWDPPDIDGLAIVARGAQPGPPPGLGHRFVRVLPQFHAAGVGPGLVSDLPLLAHLLQLAHLRGRAVLRAPEERHRSAPPGVGRGDVQGVRPPGREHPRGDPDDDRVAGRDRVPAQRPGDPAPSPAQDEPGVRRRVPTVQRGGTRPCRFLSEEFRCPTSLPPAFADLEPFAAWCLPTEAERYAKRLASPMDELQAFYDAAFPRLEEMLAYLDSFDLDSLPDDAGRLLLLAYSLVNVSFPVEVWRQARVPDSGAASMDAVVEPSV